MRTSSRHGARPDLIKIERRKGELSILRGADRTFARFGLVIVMEVGDEPGAPAGQLSARNVRHLQERGYEIFEMEGSALVRRRGPRALRRREPDLHYPEKPLDIWAPNRVAA